MPYGSPFPEQTLAKVLENTLPIERREEFLQCR